jgi:histidyl-tRNA synthetase
MHPVLFSSCLILALLVPTSVAAQNSAVQLCVANMQLAGNPSANPTGRSLLIKFLQKQKDKGIATEAVPLEASAPDQALAAAKQKNCGYLVTTDQVESHQDNSQMPSMGTFSTTSTPTFYVTTKYKLVKVSDASELSSGSFKASDRGSEENAIGFTMHKIADKVTEAIRKSGAVSK